MSLKILARGILDSIQDTGRTGYQHLGINVNGAMDAYSAQLANALLGKDLQSAVIELHFPAAEILITSSTIIAVTGANFAPNVNNQPIPLNRPVVVPANSILRFTKTLQGARSYLAVLHDLDVEPWMKSYSTNLKAASGGYEGRRLRRDDILYFKKGPFFMESSNNHSLRVLAWQAGEFQTRIENRLEIMKGNEWYWLKDESRRDLMTGKFLITHQADRMGYRLMGKALAVEDDFQLVSSGVKAGTIQLLPNGQLIVLMADSHTTGGYPRIGSVISADIPVLAQLSPRTYIRFKCSDHEAAETRLVQQREYLMAVRQSSYLKLQNYLNVHS